MAWHVARKMVAGQMAKLTWLPKYSCEWSSCDEVVYGADELKKVSWCFDIEYSMQYAQKPASSNSLFLVTPEKGRDESQQQGRCKDAK